AAPETNSRGNRIATASAGTRRTTRSFRSRRRASPVSPTRGRGLRVPPSLARRANESGPRPGVVEPVGHVLEPLPVLLDLRLGWEARQLPRVEDQEEHVLLPGEPLLLVDQPQRVLLGLHLLPVRVEVVQRAVP